MGRPTSSAPTRSVHTRLLGHTDTYAPTPTHADTRTRNHTCTRKHPCTHVQTYTDVHTDSHVCVCPNPPVSRTTLFESENRLFASGPEDSVSGSLAVTPKHRVRVGDASPP